MWQRNRLAIKKIVVFSYFLIDLNDIQQDCNITTGIAKNPGGKNIKTCVILGKHLGKNIKVFVIS